METLQLLLRSDNELYLKTLLASGSLCGTSFSDTASQSLPILVRHHGKLVTGITVISLWTANFRQQEWYDIANIKGTFLTMIIPSRVEPDSTCKSKSRQLSLPICL